MLAAWRWPRHPGGSPLEPKEAAGPDLPVHRRELPQRRWEVPFPSSAIAEDVLAAEDTGASEFAEVIEGIEALLDAYAANVIDLCPGLERLLLNLLDVATDRATRPLATTAG
jgi:hypothetical protein